MFEHTPGCSRLRTLSLVPLSYFGIFSARWTYLIEFYCVLTDQTDFCLNTKYYSRQYLIKRVISIFYCRQISVFVIDGFKYVGFEQVRFLVFFDDLCLLSTINTPRGYINARELYICLLMYVPLRLKVQLKPRSRNDYLLKIVISLLHIDCWILKWIIYSGLSLI